MNSLNETIELDVVEIDETLNTHRKRRTRLFAALGLAIAAAGGGAWAYWTFVGSHYVETDNAYTAAEVATISAEIEGTVAQVRVVDSQAVKRGDILVVLKDTDAKLAMRQAEADLGRARAQLAAANADLERSRIDLERRQALVTSGSVSGDELTRVKNDAHKQTPLILRPEPPWHWRKRAWTRPRSTLVGL